MIPKEFTIENGIEIQSMQLAGWKELLKDEVFEDLKTWATENNHLKTNGYAIVRGTDLDNYIANYIRNKKLGHKQSN